MCNDKYKWAWFHKYCTAVRAAQSFIQSTQLPASFSLSVREKLEEIKGEGEESLCLDYENNDLFHKAQDEQILSWLNRLDYFVIIPFSAKHLRILSDKTLQSLSECILVFVC